MKILLTLIMGMFTSILSFGQSIATTKSDAANIISENTGNQDAVAWFIGAILVILFTFIVIFALAKGAMAMSESIEDKYL